MRKYILIAHKDKNSPYAVEAKLQFASHNGDENMVILINVPHTDDIAPGLLHIKSHIANGVAKASQEGLDLVTKLAKLANDSQHHLGISKGMVRFVAKHLELENLSCNKCMVVCE